MSVFTVVIIIWVIYQLGISLMKKGKQQAPGNFSERFKLPDGRSIREALQEISQESGSSQSPQPRRFTDVFAQGTWGTEGTQGVEGTRGTEGTQGVEGTWGTEGTQGVEGTWGTEGTQGVEGTWGTEGTQGVEGTSEYRGTGGIEVCPPDTERETGEKIPRVAQKQSGFGFPTTENQLVQGIVWAEILGKPRALHPFRGPRG